ncbi:TetR/AcrR family transcriptional regulator [Mycolicibacterium septicum]|uniref:TetR/AcrR family transcriptional regulator n=1 Tax=Mycolicibacterium septicum TaxID=98668 RepID=A0ABW9LRL0_9MYCO|nr:TetR/AcrR family transcriptional regulator [Mycobacteriaceae bacterium Msp059]
MQESPADTGSKDKLRRAALHCIAQRGYAVTSSRDIAREAGVNVASINYHFGSKDALVTEALGECFGLWNQRVETAFVGAAGLPPHDQLAAILRVAIDSFAEVRSSIHACVETYAPALRSDELRERMAAGYATVRESAVQLAANAMHEGGMPVPDNLAAIASVLMAVCDGLMLQWIADPTAPPDSAATLDALSAIGVLAGMR